jgi:hypothetical protein
MRQQQSQKNHFRFQLPDFFGPFIDPGGGLVRMQFQIGFFLRLSENRPVRPACI